MCSSDLGHTITAFAAAGVVWACVWMEQRKNSANYIHDIVLASVLLLAFLVGVSRMAVGAHWPFDVLAGACVGWLAGLNGAYIAHRWQSTWNTDTARWLLHFLCCALTLDLIDKSLEDPVGVFMLWLGVLSAWGALIWKCFHYWKQR